MLVIVAIGAWLAAGVFEIALARSEPAFEPTWYMVVDRANLLDEKQEASAINDTWRLNLEGIPAQVVTELTESTPELTRRQADALLVEHGIESAPGAGDGVLIYAAVNPADRSLVTVAIATGPNALPRDGLVQDDIAEIQSIIVLPQLTAGHPARAIVYSVREMIYQLVFTPPPSTPPSGAKQSLNDWMPWLAPVVAIPVTVLALRTLRDTRTVRGALMRAALPLAGGLALAAVAVNVQSAPGMFWSIGLMLVGVAVLILADRVTYPAGGPVPVTPPRSPGRLSSGTGKEA